MNMHFKKRLAAALAVCVLLPHLALASPLRYDMDFKQTPLKDTLLGLGYQSGQNIIINGDLGGHVSMSIRQKSVEEILSLLATTHGFSYIFDGDTILVSPSEQMSKIVSYPVKYLDLEAARQQLSLYIPPEKIFVNAADSTLTVDGSPIQHKKAAEHLHNMDKPIQQIKVKAAIIEYTQAKARDLGLDFSFDSYVKGNQGVNYAIASSQEETYSKGNVLARPSLVVANAHEASIMMGDKVPVFTSESSDDDGGGNTVTVEYKDVGVNLKVLPRINDLEKGLITLVLRPEISSITKWVESGNNKAPQISSRQLETTIRVKSGQTIILGGLLKDEEIKNIKALPLLSKLPILGHLFKHSTTEKAKTEICIALTPEIIVDKDGVPRVSFQEANAPDEIPAQTSADADQTSAEELEKSQTEKEEGGKEAQEDRADLLAKLAEMENLLNAYIAKEYQSIKED